MRSLRQGTSSGRRRRGVYIVTGHRIFVRHSAVGAEDRLSVTVIKRCIRTVLSIEGIDPPCEVSVLVTGDSGIRGINREFRGIDKATDVLSFPMHSYVPGAAMPGAPDTDPETGLLALGDIVMSAPGVIKQARENGQSTERETAYLTVHSVLHLLGYDHTVGAAGKKLMRGREKAIMGEIDRSGLLE